MAEEGEPPMQSSGKPADTSQLASYLLRVVPALLESDQDVPEVVTLQTILKDNDGKLKRFIEDNQEHTLSVFYTLPPEESNGTSFQSTFDIQLGVQFLPQQYSAGLIFTKRIPVIEGDKPMRSQLRFLVVSEYSPFETLHAHVQDAIKVFNSFVQQSRREESESDKLVTSVQKNMNELAVGLLHLQQNIAIPEISLPIHPIIAKAVEKAAEADRKPSVADVHEHISDATFLNTLQKQVALWTKEIRKVTTMQQDVSSGTALQEVNFWINMEHALMRVRNKRESPEVVLTLEVLKAGKRSHTILSFDSDTGLRTIQDRVTDYNILMKDFPLKELLAADSLLVIEDVIKNSIFTHLKKIRHTNYPTERAVGLVEAISRDLLNQLLKCLSTHKLMIVTYKEFEEVNVAVVKVFTTWDEQFEMFTTQLRDLAKKKKGETMKFHFKYNLMHKKLEARFVQLKEFRHQHEQLQSVICCVLKLAQQAKSLKQQGASTPASNDIMSGEEQLLDEVRLAYDNVKVIDCLDLLADGTALWDTALKRYEERIDRVETRIAARLRDQLGSARNANEMFRIFSRYNSLFIRPHIRGAIREYQAQLMQRVKEDIEKLHVKFKMQYNKTHTYYALCSMLDIPPISSSIMLARQLEHQLQIYLNRVEAVLGPDWHIEGQHLKAYADSLKLKLDPSPLFEDWKKKVENKQMVQGKIFDIISQRGESGSFVKLLINFNEDTISLYKEVRSLRAMKFRIPFSVSCIATQANQLYPHAVCLKESIRTYEQTCQKISDNDSIVPLVAGLKIDVQSLIKEGINLTWESCRLEGFVQKFSECVFNFQEKVDEVLHHTEQIYTLIGGLSTCEYSSNKFAEILDEVQKLVDNLNLRSYTNLMEWVKNLDKQVEAMLTQRLSAAVIAWRDSQIGQSEDTAPLATPLTFKLGGTPEVEDNVGGVATTSSDVHLLLTTPPIQVTSFIPRDDCNIPTDISTDDNITIVPIPTAITSIPGAVNSSIPGAINDGNDILVDINKTPTDVNTNIPLVKTTAVVGVQTSSSAIVKTTAVVGVQTDFVNTPIETTPIETTPNQPTLAEYQLLQQEADQLKEQLALANSVPSIQPITIEPINIDQAWTSAHEESRLADERQIQEPLDPADNEQPEYIRSKGKKTTILYPKCDHIPPELQEQYDEQDVTCTELCAQRHHNSSIVHRFIGRYRARCKWHLATLASSRRDLR